MASGIAGGECVDTRATHPAASRVVAPCRPPPCAYSRSRPCRPLACPDLGRQLAVVNTATKLCRRLGDPPASRSQGVVSRAARHLERAAASVHGDKFAAGWRRSSRRDRGHAVSHVVFILASSGRTRRAALLTRRVRWSLPCSGTPSAWTACYIRLARLPSRSPACPRSSGVRRGRRRLFGMVFSPPSARGVTTVVSRPRC